MAAQASGRVIGRRGAEILSQASYTFIPQKAKWLSGVRSSHRSSTCSFSSSSSLRRQSHSKKSSSQSQKSSLPYVAVGAAVLGVSGGLAYYFKYIEPKRYNVDTNQTIVDVRYGESSYVPQKPKPGERSAIPPSYPDFEAMPEIPGYAPYVIIGGGTAAAAAFRGIRTREPKAQILVIAEEEFLPYMRTPLSKELWYTDDEKAPSTLRFKQWSGEYRSIFHHPESFYTPPRELAYKKNGGVAVVKNRTVLSIEPMEKKIHLDNGWEVFYDRCLIATGGAPRNIKALEAAEGSVKDKVFLFRGIKDMQKLAAVAKDNNTKTMVIIGGGFLGSELACALAYKSSLHRKGSARKFDVVQIFPEAGNMDKVLPKYLSDWTTEKIKEEGVKTVSNAMVESAKSCDGRVLLKLSNGDEVAADAVVVAVGLEPRCELAATSGLEVDNSQGGFLVNAELEARSNIWVAGDAACFYDMKLGRRRVEHHDHAVVSGRLAGENMAGAGKPYWHQSMFWSDLGPDVSYEAIGVCDSSLPTVSVFAKPHAHRQASSGEEPTTSTVTSQGDEAGQGQDESVTKAGVTQGQEFGKGVVFYLRDKVVVGIVMWNVFKGSKAARKIMMDGEERTEDELVELAKLFNLYPEDDEPSLSGGTH